MRWLLIAVLVTGDGAEIVTRATTSRAVQVTGAITGRFYRMDSANRMETWEFVSDGTYLRTTIAGGRGAAVRTSERGTYRIANGVMEVQVTKTTGASTTTVTGGDRTTMTGATPPSSEVRRYRITLLGTNGSAGMELDGAAYKVKSW